MGSATSFLESDEIYKLPSRLGGQCPNKVPNMLKLVDGMSVEPLNEPLTEHTANSCLRVGVEWEGRGVDRQ